MAPDTTSTMILAAGQDQDLKKRMIAIAAAMGEEFPQAWVEQNIFRLAAAEVSEDGDTVASVYEYALATYAPVPRPGENLAAVTDDQLRAAVTKIKTTPTDAA